MERNGKSREEVRAVSDIVSVIGQYIPIKNRGKSYTGLCPFHTESTPSFSVSPELQAYQCFGCSSSGDVFDFIMKIEGIDFRDAMELLCNRSGIEFVPKGSEDRTVNIKRTLSEVNQVAQNYFSGWFQRSKNSPSASTYLSDRGITVETADKFGMGIAPTASTLPKLMRDSDTWNESVDLGLINDYGNDSFAGRFTLPIHDGMGRIAGFGGRDVSGKSGVPKYINSPDSPIFNKSRLFFGFKQAWRNIVAGEIPVIMEGFFDVMAAHQIGIKTAIGTMGTALTHQHAELLATHTDRIIFCYDSDDAGNGAVMHGAKVWQEVVGPTAQIRVAVLPSLKDPADMVADGKDQELFRIIHGLMNSIEVSVSYENHLIDMVLRKYDTSRDDDRHRALNEVLGLIKDIRPFHVRDACLMKVAHLHPFYDKSVAKAIQSLTADMNYFSSYSSRK